MDYLPLYYVFAAFSIKKGSFLLPEKVILERSPVCTFLITQYYYIPGELRFRENSSWMNINIM
jgi:hypothetical protein